MNRDRKRTSATRRIEVEQQRSTILERYGKLAKCSTLSVVQLREFVAIFVNVNIALKLSLNLVQLFVAYARHAVEAAQRLVRITQL